MDDTAPGIDNEDMATLLAALAPRDALESMLAVQMAAVHAAAVRRPSAWIGGREGAEDGSESGQGQDQKPTAPSNSVCYAV